MRRVTKCEARNIDLCIGVAAMRRRSFLMRISMSAQPIPQSAELMMSIARSPGTRKST